MYKYLHYLTFLAVYTIIYIKEGSLMKNLFYKCEVCGNIIGKVLDSGVPVVCCGQKMNIIPAQMDDTKYEKHQPVVTITEQKVEINIGSVPHPMLGEHYIQWVYLQTDKGGQRRNLLPNENPTVTFYCIDEKPLAVFSFCNMHGLWVTEL
jgi:superoxide reductase